MRVLVLLAHPEPASFTHAVAARAVGALRSCGHEVTVHDLYAEGFVAAMSAEERRSYHSETPVSDPLVAEHIERLQAADALVFVYPTWWSSMPAVLKGWLERIMVPGVGFVFDAAGKVRPGLPNVRRIVGISTYGSRRAYVRLINDNGRRTLRRALWLSTSRRTRTAWLGLYGMDSSTPDERAGFLDKVARRMERL